MTSSQMNKQPRVLIVSSGNRGRISPFVSDQAKALEKQGVSIDFFLVVGKGIRGYLKNYFSLKKKIRTGNYDLVHAHFGLSGLLANLQRKVPVVLTLHGSDLMGKKLVRQLSLIAIRLSRHVVFVSDRIFNIGKKAAGNNYTILACGVDFDTFKPMDKDQAREKLSMDAEKSYILFASSFDNPVKNASLAKEAVTLIPEPTKELVEMKGQSREQIALLMNACDVLLVTSLRETGPLVVKEALACNLPVVSVDVGDVSQVLAKIDGCFICKHDGHELAEAITNVLKKKERIKGRDTIQRYNNNDVARQLLSVYSSIIV